MTGMFYNKPPSADKVIGRDDVIAYSMTEPLSFGSTVAGSFFESARFTSVGLGMQAMEFADDPVARQMVEFPDGRVEPFRPRQFTRELHKIPEAIQKQINRRWETADEVSQRTGYPRDKLLSEDEYKSSEWFREEIPYTPAMTITRAQALAEAADYKAVAEFYGKKRPLASIVGSFGGAAVDPINYIPMVGPAARAASLAKFGRVGGTALVASTDAAVNTAVFQALSAPSRAEYGDDVSFQNYVTDVAMAALIGGAFGTVTGVLGKRADDKVRIAAEDKLNTVQNRQTAISNLNDAVDGLLRNDKVDLRTASISFVDDTANKIYRQDIQLTPDQLIDSAAKAADAETFKRLNDVNRLLEINQQEVNSLDAVLNSQQTARLRQDMQELDELRARHTALRERADNAPAEQAEELNAQADELGEEVARKAASIDQEQVRQLEVAEEQRAAHEQNIRTFTDEKAELEDRASLARKASEDEFWKSRAETEEDAAQRAAFYRTFPDLDDPATNPESNISIADQADALPTPEEIADAGTNPRGEITVGQEPTLEEIARNNGITENGGYVEEANIEALRAEGRLTEQDEALLRQADEEVQKANNYAKALVDGVACFF